MADPDQQDFDEFDTLVDDTADTTDDLSFDRPDNGRKKRQAVFYVILVAFIALVGLSVWFVFLRQPETTTAITPVAENTTPPSGDLPPGVSSEESANAIPPALDPATGQPINQAAAQNGDQGATIVPVDSASVNPEVATPQIASPEVAAVDNAASPSATVSSTGTTVEALPPPIAPTDATTDATAPTGDATLTPVEEPKTDAVNIAPSAPDATAPATDMAALPEPAAIEPVSAPPVTETPASASDVTAPVAAPVASEATNTAIDQRLSQIEEQVKSVSSAAGTSSGASPELAAQLKALTQKLDNLTTQVESLDQRTTNFATELQNRSATSSNDTIQSAPKPVKKAAPKPARKPVAKKASAATSSWELRSAQPGVAWLGKPGSGEMSRFAIGQTAPGLGTIQDVSQEGGRWIVKTSGGTLRQ